MCRSLHRRPARRRERGRRSRRPGARPTTRRARSAVETTNPAPACRTTGACAPVFARVECACAPRAASCDAPGCAGGFDSDGARPAPLCTVEHRPEVVPGRRAPIEPGENRSACRRLLAHDHREGVGRMTRPPFILLSIRGARRCSTAAHDRTIDAANQPHPDRRHVSPVPPARLRATLLWRIVKRVEAKLPSH